MRNSRKKIIKMVTRERDNMKIKLDEFVASVEEVHPVEVVDHLTPAIVGDMAAHSFLGFLINVLKDESVDKETVIKKMDIFTDKIIDVALDFNVLDDGTLSRAVWLEKARACRECWNPGRFNWRHTVSNMK